MQDIQSTYLQKNKDSLDYTSFLHLKKIFFFNFSACISVSPTECGFASYSRQPIRCCFTHQILFCVNFSKKNDS